MSSDRARFALFCGVLAMILVACGGDQAQPQDDGRSRPESLSLTGGKADVPDWIAPKNQLLGCTDGIPMPTPLPPEPLAASFSDLQPESSLIADRVTGSFSGTDSAHLYPLRVEADQEMTLEFVASYAPSRGAAIAVYDLTGDRLALQRNPDRNSAELEFTAPEEGYYLVAVYSVAWIAYGSYDLSVSCTTIVNECWGAWLDEFGNCRGPADGVLPDHCCQQDFCGGIAGIPCPEGMRCKLDGDYPDAGGHCVPMTWCEVDSDCDHLPMLMYCMGRYECQTNTCTFLCEWEQLCEDAGGVCGALTSEGVQCPDGYEANGDAGKCAIGGGCCTPIPTPTCEDAGGVCGALTAEGIQCPDGYTPDGAAGTCLLGGGCCMPDEPQCFVGGCSGQYCTSQPGLISTCEWLPHYACYKLSECGTFGPAGACGWKQTPEFLQCMIDTGFPQ